MSNYSSFLKDAEIYYGNIRRKNSERANHYLSVLHADEKYLEAFNRYNGARFELSKAKYDGDEEMVKKISAIIEDAKNTMNGIKAEKKIKNEWLLPSFTCTVCKDTGKTADGNYCKCFKKFVKEEICLRLGLPEKNYPDFDEAAKKTDNRLDVIYSKMRGYIDKFPLNEKSPIVISGAVGVGKSHLAAAVTGKIIEKGFNAIFLSAYELHTVFLKYAFAPLGEKDGYIEVLTDCDLLVIDDLGCEPILNNVSLQCLYNVINERKMNNAPIIITTNLNAEQISERYGECLFSRIFDRKNGAEIRITGDDLRIKK